MPPRYAYWTILIDGKATAFRARDREELLPTFNQLSRKNADIAMRYFARGRLWDNPEQAQWANRNRPMQPTEPRDRSWRPGGEHKDPRARFEDRGTRRAARTERPRKASEPAKTGTFEQKARSSDRKPFNRAHKPFNEGQRPFKAGEKPFKAGHKPFKAAHKPFKGEEGKHPFEGRPNDRRPPKFGAPTGKREGRWNRPPKRDKPR